MTTWVALLRAVNVGGRKLPMAELRTIAERLGWQDVRTYIQSGNLVLAADGKAAELEARLEQAIAAATGLEVPVVIRDGEQWEAMVAANPFPDLARTAPNRLLLLLSKQALAPDAAIRLAERAADGERLQEAGGALWCYYAEGVGNSKLTPAAIDRACGSPTTGRNVRTAWKLLEMLKA